MAVRFRRFRRTSDSPSDSPAAKVSQSLARLAGLIGGLIFCLIWSLQPSTAVAQRPNSARETKSNSSGRPASARIELELCTEPGVAPTATQQWLAALKDLDVAGLRIRGATGVDRPEIQKRGTDKNPSYLVIGIISPGGKLSLPGAAFTMNDSRKLTAWLDKLKQGGEEELSTKRGAFGLSAPQFIQLNERLSPRVNFDTRDQSPRAMAKKISDLIGLPITVDAEAKEALAVEDLVADELRGVSAGTALAAVLRPVGLVVVPGVSGQELGLRVTTVRKSSESWPVGWPTDEGAGKTAPQLLKTIEVEIKDTPLDEALEAIGERLKIPMLFDHNGIARQRIDLAAARVNQPQAKTFYGKILDRALFPNKLRWEIRLDESGAAFLWISPQVK